MWTTEVNWLAVIVAAVINMAVGAFWYSPMAFGKAWMKAIGKTEADIRASSGNMALTYGVTAIGALVQVFILAMLVRLTGAENFGHGLLLGLWVWLGFIAVFLLNEMTFGGRPVVYCAITGGFFLVTLLVSGGILAAWR